MLNQMLKLIYFLSVHKYCVSAFCKPQFANLLPEIPAERKWQNCMEDYLQKTNVKNEHWPDTCLCLYSGNTYYPLTFMVNHN